MVIKINTFPRIHYLNDCLDSILTHIDKQDADSVWVEGDISFKVLSILIPYAYINLPNTSYNTPQFIRYIARFTLTSQIRTLLITCNVVSLPMWGREEYSLGLKAELSLYTN